MKKLLALSLMLTGCVSIQRQPVSNLNVLGNPYVKCVDTHGSETRGIFVCKKELRNDIIEACRAVPHTEGWIVINQDAIGTYRAFDPIFTPCYVIDPNGN